MTHQFRPPPLSPPPTTEERAGWPWCGDLPDPDPDVPVPAGLPKISVVTPSYNQGQFLEATIRSVLLQRYPNLEYIIIDGGSSDASVEIIAHHAPWLHHWSSSADRGQYDALNRGFAHTSGEIMLWINSDDMLMPHCLHTLAELFSRFSGEVEWITGLPAYWSQEGQLQRVVQPPIYHPLLMRNGAYDGRGIGGVMQECCAWTRTLWEAAGGHLDETLDYAADFELWLRFSRHASLYQLSTLLGANRRWADQKTATTAPYYREVDALLQRHPRARRINWLCRNRYSKLLIRACLALSAGRRSIDYSAATMRWEITH